MQRNCIECMHCGKTFARLTEQTPLINRSDGMRFHVTLFAGPSPRLRFSGGFYRNQVICNFAYVHDQFGAKDHTVSVFIVHAEEDPNEALHQVEDAADKLTELVEAGKKMTAVYTFNRWELTPGFPI